MVGSFLLHKFSVPDTVVLLFLDILLEEGQEPGDAHVPNSGENANDNKYKEIFTNKAVHYMAAFCIIYIGVEVTMGGK